MSEQEQELPRKHCNCGSLLVLAVALGMLILLRPWYALLLGQLTRLSMAVSWWGNLLTNANVVHGYNTDFLEE